jgi:TPR repeat protein
MQVIVLAGLATLALSIPVVLAPQVGALGDEVAAGHKSTAISCSLGDQSAGDPRYKLVQLFNINPGAPQNPAEALKELRKNAEQGDPNAQYMLALTYDVGVGAAQDFAEAAIWYRKAAEQGHAGAQFNLGHLYADGRGVTLDLVQAHMWLNLAAAGSQPGARNGRDLVAKKMTRSQIAEALRLAREWLPKANPSPPETKVSPPSDPPGSTEDRNRP